ncbi:MAG: TolC family protein [Bacteroidales bacterium]
MKIIRIITVCLIVLMTSIASAQKEYLNSYLKVAAENNPELKAKFNEYLAALEVVPQVNTLADPEIMFAYFASPVETREGPQQFKISASQLFPWFGTLAAKKNVAIETAKTKYEIFKESKAKLFHEVRATYFNLYFNKKAIEITINNIEILHSFQKLANIKVKAGIVSVLDEYRIEMEINELENQLAILRDKSHILEVIFKNSINNKQIQTIYIPTNLWTEDFPLTRQEGLDSVSSLNHQLLALDFQQATLQHQQKLAQKSGKPNIKLGFDYTFIGKGQNNLSGKDAFVFPSIGLSIPLYRNKYKAKVQEVIYLKEAKSFEKENKANMLEILFEEGWKDYTDAQRRIDLYHRQFNLAKKSIKILETDYATGSEKFEEILRMERNLLKYNLEKEKAISDKQAAIAFLNYLMGK